MRNIRNLSKILFTVLITATILSSCEKYIEFEGENKPPRLVVNGLIEPDSVFRVDLSHSLGFIDVGEIRSVENGTVDVFLKNGPFLETLAHMGDGIYEGSLVALAGESYRVEAAAAGMADVSAVDIVPYPVAIANWDTITSTSEGFFGSSSLNVSFTITDPAGENYYAIEAFEAQYYTVDVVGYDPQTEQPIYDTIYFDNPQRFALGLSTNDVVLTSEYTSALGDGILYDNRFLFSDELFRGSTRTFNFNIDYFTGSSDMEIKLTSISADLFQYYRTQRSYNDASGDPFSEPVQVFSNIEGGLGIWGGQSSQSILIEF